MNVKYMTAKDPNVFGANAQEWLFSTGSVSGESLVKYEMSVFKSLFFLASDIIYMSEFLNYSTYLLLFCISLRDYCMGSFSSVFVRRPDRKPPNPLLGSSFFGSSNF